MSKLGPISEQFCPCGSRLAFQDCCEPIITGRSPARTPEALMRSRYTAYTQGNIDYLEKTMRGKALENFDREDAKQWVQNVKWIGLEVLSSKIRNDKGYVEFIATFEEQGKQRQMREHSKFFRKKGRWYYIDYVEK